MLAIEIILRIPNHLGKFLNLTPMFIYIYISSWIYSGRYSGRCSERYLGFLFRDIIQGYYSGICYSGSDNYFKMRINVSLLYEI